jgi:hypothetical protein
VRPIGAAPSVRHRDQPPRPVRGAERLVSGAACPVAVAVRREATHTTRPRSSRSWAWRSTAPMSRSGHCGGRNLLARPADARLRVITVAERLAFGARPGVGGPGRARSMA